VNGENRNAYLTIRFEGPEVKPGRMRLDDFIQAASEFSIGAQRVALVLQHSPSVAEGRRPRELTQTLSLDLVGFTEGSPAAVVHLERTEPQMEIDEVDLGEKTYRVLLGGIDAVAGPTDALPEGFDLGVLLKLRDLGKLFNKGVSRIEFQLNHRLRPAKAVYDPVKYERVRQRIARPEAQQVTLQGRLLMADFKETGRQIRIHPSIGQPVICHFDEALSQEVEECMRRYVRVTGRMVFTEVGEPRWIELTDIDAIETSTGTVAEPESTWSYDFWENLSASEYATRQGVQPVRDIAALYGPGHAEDWEGFDEAVERWRTENPLK
jgi:hypothetical protein